jgi:hypothetical protein
MRRDGGTLKIGLISNTRSRRNKRRLPKPPGTLHNGVEVLHRPLEGVAGMAEVLDEFAGAEVGLIAINGGDGTISAALTALLERPRFEERPPVALLSGGMLNMSAADAGLGGAPEKALARLVARAAQPDLALACVEREVIRLNYSRDKPSVCGLFFGTAAIYRGIVLCTQRVHAIKLKSSAAAAATLAYMVARSFFKRGKIDPLLRGDDMTVRFDGAPAQKVTQFLALVTTLDRLMLKSRPYWGQESGRLRYMGIAYPPRRLGRSAYRVLYGSPDRRLPENFVSHNADQVAFDMTCPFALDGELYEPEPGTPVELSGAGRLRFVRC